MATALSTPFVSPADDTLAAFFKRIAYLTTRTRVPRSDGWAGCPEVVIWNAMNREACSRCRTSRGLVECTVGDDSQSTCDQCRRSKLLCDRKLRFLFDATRDEFFSTREQFSQVYNFRDRRRCRTLKKSANKRLKTVVMFVNSPRSVVEEEEDGKWGKRRTICLTNAAENIAIQQALCSARKEIEELRAQIRAAQNEACSVE
ncbi:hypothetical protein C8R46DRAFT_1053052 [Mycena filopes]|nr:hypothetical protein C8R46DRAFT_1053052 [Mycena filopes]